VGSGQWSVEEAEKEKEEKEPRGESCGVFLFG
jgi:hypothetical protein